MTYGALAVRFVADLGGRFVAIWPLLTAKSGSCFFNRPPRSARVDHAMAVGADKREVFEAGLRAFAERGDRNGVMALNEASPAFTIPLEEVEAADFTAELPGITQDRALLAPH